ncbi:chaplin family protein [Streptomyces sp. NBC_01361]|uniref:chaplin family protein n=1 Tax=Streptomyces sp. NBC_01361 TaxID=2903838 RepID=UPI003FCD417D
MCSTRPSATSASTTDVRLRSTSDHRPPGIPGGRSRFRPAGGQLIRTCASRTPPASSVRPARCLVQVLVQVPVNATGNSVNVIGLLNPTFGNASENS